MSDKMKNLIVRAASGAVMLAVFVGAIFASQWSFGALMLAVVVGCQYEFYSLCRRKEMSPQSVIGIACGVAIFCSCFIFFRLLGTGGAHADIDMEKVIFLGVATFLGPYIMLLLPTMFVCELWRRGSNPMANIATTVTGVVYTALPLSMLLFVPILLGGGEWNPCIMLGYMLVVWSNDVFAYLVGCAVGRHRMFERISPKKSWEGFAGGIIGAVLVGWGVSLWVDGNAVVWCGLSLVAAVAGVGGDLVESMFKRSADVKDSGNIMPGHGGWLDRFDAVLISTPFVLVYLLAVCGFAGFGF